MGQLETFNCAVDCLNQAALDERHWPQAAAALDEASGTTGNLLVFGEDVDGAVRIYSATYYTRGERRQDRERAYFTHYYPRDERLPRLRRLPDSLLVATRELFTPKELQTSPVYNELLLRTGGQNGLQVRLDGPDNTRIVWTLSDPVESSGWGPAQIESIRQLLPHIRQYVRLRVALGRTGMLADSFAELLDNARIGVIQLDRHGRILEANAKACEALQGGGTLSDRGGFLGARQPDHDRRLEALLAGATPSGGGPGRSGALMLPSGSGSGGVTLHVHPLAGDLMASVGGEVAAFALVADSQKERIIDARWVARFFGLSRAESRVAASLAEGRSVSDMARAFNRTEGGVRWTLKQIYRKLGISRQSDLVRLVLTASGLVRDRLRKPW